jgi:hypothetical protein
MIKTRKDPADQIVGHGDCIMALTTDQLELIGAMMGMIKLGRSPYQEAAYQIIDMLEELTGDDEYTSYCLGAVQPILEVHGENYDVIATYDDDHIFEFVV